MGAGISRAVKAPALDIARRARRSTSIWTSQRFVSWGFILATLLLWETVQSIPLINPTFLPTPHSIAGRFVALLLGGELVSNASYTVLRVIGGFCFGALVGIPLGLAMGLSRIIDDVVGPPVHLLRPIAPIAWIPLTILFFGLQWQGPVFIVFIGSFFPFVIASFAAVRDIEPVVVNCVRTLGASYTQVLQEVILPGSVPTILMGGRIALGLSWNTVMAAELFGARYGIGYLINSASMNFHVVDVFVGMTAIGLLGYASDVAYMAFVRRRLAWMSGLEELEAA